MRLVVQRVKEAKVKKAADKRWIGKIKKGLFVLLGVEKRDTRQKALNLAEKLYKLRIMAGENGKMNLSLKDTGMSVLVVSQFTLYADTSGGNRPSFINAAEVALAEDIYKFFVKSLRDEGILVETGSFGDYMRIDVELDGPVTIILQN